ncbi:MAG: L,D-transpeptidase family protein [Ignavibacteria bacterium]|jgi:hypothetical protein|nr:L,D-transpeptidase family protein [Ignavibacteria bacterium]
MKKIIYCISLLIIFSAAVLRAEGFDTVKVEAESIVDADKSVSDYLTDHFPILPDFMIEKILKNKAIEITEKSEGESAATFFRIKYLIPQNFLLDTMKILWELNIPEFRSHLFQIYKSDTLYLDTWNNVVGTAKDKTYTGRFEAYRVRNWPSWKDPEPGKENLPATPPGPKNPLGLFVVHYDENSLRYFHGTNKEYLLDDENRSLSHGCVRNYNDNIARMKEFLIKRVIKSEDLSSWLDSKRSMTYDFEDIDRFPVRIIYKTFSVNKDESGYYVELYRDIYNYSNPRNINVKWNEADLITLTTEENLKSEIKSKTGNLYDDAKIDEIVDAIMNKTEKYRKFYFSELGL